MSLTRIIEKFEENRGCYQIILIKQYTHTENGNEGGVFKHVDMYNTNFQGVNVVI